jgi:hypothetical protein
VEQLVILLVIGAISLVKWLLEKSAEAREQRKAAERFEKADRPAAPSPLRPVPPAFDRDEAARKLREALGLPDEAEVPPPLPAPEPVILFERPLPEPPPQVFAPDLERRYVEVVEEEGPPAVPFSAPVPTPVPPADRKPAASGTLEDLLRSREGLRRAILAREILGPPKGLAF